MKKNTTKSCQIQTFFQSQQQHRSASEDHQVDDTSVHPPTKELLAPITAAAASLTTPQVQLGNGTISADNGMTMPLFLLTLDVFILHDEKYGA
eukprot:scaffold92357_cov47-Attheya_sp.AAC.2